MERGETDVAHLLFAKYDALIGRVIVRLREISSRGCGCATHQRKTNSSRTQRRQGGRFGCAFLLRSLLDAWHDRILQKFSRKRLTWQACGRPIRARSYLGYKVQSIPWSSRSSS